jgi:hypothetical protein
VSRVHAAARRWWLSECLWPGVTEAAALEAVARIRRACAQLDASAAAVRFLDGILVLEDEILSCRFEGTQQAVLAVHDMADVSPDRLVPFVDVVADSCSAVDT